MNAETAFIDSITKPKTPKGYAYILKSSQLNRLLSDNDLSVHIALSYWIPQKTGSVFEVHFWQPNEKVPYPRLYIRAGALRKEDAAAAREALINEVFPQFIKWADNILKLTDNSPKQNEEPYFNAVYEDGRIKIIF